MNAEFHYHMTYLIAAKAGLGAENSLIVAKAAQFVDDNSVDYTIDKGKPSEYRNYISQTMNIIQPKAKLFRIYPLFHFWPGDVDASAGQRRDGLMHKLNTTPGSQNARWALKQALATGNLFRIGVAAHGFADTWAHQNFVGYLHPFNVMPSVLGYVAPPIGHATAGHNPDWPALVWTDSRLTDKRVDNKRRFLEAAREMLCAFARYADPSISEASLSTRAEELVRDLSSCIGEQDQTNQNEGKRIGRYLELSTSPAYGGRKLVPYDEDEWFAAAVNERIRGLHDRKDPLRFDPLTDVFTWKNPAGYKSTEWYRFQETVKQHQDELWDYLKERNFKGLELPDL